MAMTLNAATRQQSTATIFPARRSTYRRAALASPLLRCANPHSVLAPEGASIDFRLQDSQAVNLATESPEGLAILDALALNVAPSIALIPVGAHDPVPFQLATLDEEDDDDDDLDEDDDLLDEEDDEDLDEDDEDEDEDEEDDDYEDLDDEDDEEEEDEEDE